MYKLTCHLKFKMVCSLYIIGTIKLKLNHKLEELEKTWNRENHVPCLMLKHLEEDFQE